MTDWHLIHLGHLALSGAALLTIEATAFCPRGGYRYADVGLFSDECEAAIRPRAGEHPSLVGHADRHSARPRRTKGFQRSPWKGGGPIRLNRATAGRRLPRRQSRSSQVRTLLWPWTGRACAGSGTDLPMQLGGPPGSVSTPFSSMRLTAISFTSSSRPYRTGVRTLMAVPREPDAFSARGVRGRPRRLSDQPRRGDPRLGHGLGGGRLDDRGNPRHSHAPSMPADAARSMFKRRAHSHAAHISVGPSYQVPLARAVKAATAMPVARRGSHHRFRAGGSNPLHRRR